MKGKVGKRPLQPSLAAPHPNATPFNFWVRVKMKSPALSPFLFSIFMAFSSAALAEDMRPTGSSRPLQDPPRRAPGLWRITTISPEVGMQTNDVCIGEDDSIVGPRASGCAKPSVTRVQDQVIVTIECVAGDKREVESFLFTGDFQSWYRAQSRITSGARRSGFTIDAKFLRPNCGL